MEELIQLCSDAAVKALKSHAAVDHVWLATGTELNFGGDPTLSLVRKEFPVQA